MPVSWRIADDCVLLESSETATLMDWMVALDNAIASPSFKRGMAVVHDTRRRLRVPGSLEMRQGVRFLASAARATAILRWALVARSGVDAGMGQILGSVGYQPKPELRVFGNLVEAVAWARGEEA